LHSDARWGGAHINRCEACARAQEEPYFSGTLNDIGCRYTVESEVLKISQGAMTMMKEKKVNILYHLLGETVIGTTAVLLGESDSNLMAYVFRARE